MKVGARNQLKATVTEIKRGDVMCEVKVRLPNESGPMASVMSVESLEDMGLKPGDSVQVVVKAINVLLMKE